MVRKLLKFYRGSEQASLADFLIGFSEVFPPASPCPPTPPEALDLEPCKQLRH